MSGLEDLYREIILDHYRSPRNKGELETPPAIRTEGFNPLLLLGLSREPQLLVDPRARNDDDRDNNVELRTTPVSFFVTSSDSISITLHANRDFTSSVEDNMIYLTAVRTGPGRAFTAEDKPNNAQINCTANTVGTNIMF